MVNGLVYQVVAIASGMLLRSGMAQRRELSICTGPGIIPQKRPIATAPGTERRFRCQRFGWLSHGRKGAAHFFARTASGFGRYWRKARFTRRVSSGLSRQRKGAPRVE